MPCAPRRLEQGLQHLSAPVLLSSLLPPSPPLSGKRLFPSAMLKELEKILLSLPPAALGQSLEVQGAPVLPFPSQHTWLGVPGPLREPSSMSAPSEQEPGSETGARALSLLDLPRWFLEVRVEAPVPGRVQGSPLTAAPRTRALSWEGVGTRCQSPTPGTASDPLQAAYDLVEDGEDRRALRGVSRESREIIDRKVRKVSDRAYLDREEQSDAETETEGSETDEELEEDAPISELTSAPWQLEELILPGWPRDTRDTLDDDDVELIARASWPGLQKLCLAGHRFTCTGAAALSSAQGPCLRVLQLTSAVTLLTSAPRACSVS